MTHKHLVPPSPPPRHPRQTLLRAGFTALLFLAALRGANVSAANWDTGSDTWTATDALGRSLPLHAQTGPPRTNKTVAIFYFLWLGQHGEAGPFDISKILAAEPGAMSQPDSPLWGPLHAPHHWGESLFGYYVFDDEGVLAQHAQMLADAGVDAVIFDVTNQLSYPRSWQALCRVWDRIRRRGGRVPQIAFLCPFWSPKKVVNELYDQLYAPGLYPELWFRWQGKPLILADPALLGATLAVEKHDSAVELRAGHALGQSFTADQPMDTVSVCCPTWKTTDAAATLTLRRNGPGGERVARQRFETVPDNAWLALRFTNALPPGAYFLELSEPQGKVGWWSHSKDLLPHGTAFVDGAAAAGDRTLRVSLAEPRLAAMRSFFTFRKPQPDYFVGPTGPDQWGWLEVHPQHAFTNAAGQVEEVTVGVAQNAVDGKLSVLSNPRAHGRSFHRGRQPGPEGQDFTGRNFAEQWERAFALDPPCVFITGWNEWIAGRFKQPSGFHGDGPVTFVDQFNREYSRDIEPMKGGHGDAFYYQMIANIRRFKGTRALPAVTPRSIRVDGRFDDWAEVRPEFRDDLGDPAQRDHRGWGKETRYANQTGRNDLVAAKVSFDERHVYFYVRTAAPLTPSTDPNWMLLFLDVDGHPTNGWLGYDFVVNRAGLGAGRTKMQRQQGDGYHWGAPIKVEVRLGEREIELAIPRAALGLARLPATIDFKWADHIQQTGEWSDFTLNGDAAPNGRFNYRAVLERDKPAE
jgi:hypothetical protein